MAKSRSALPLFNPPMWSRRDAMWTAAASGCALLISGCHDELEKATETVRRSSVPIRIAMVGSDQEAEVISRTWASVDEQSVAITPLRLNPAKSKGFIKQLLEQTRNSDLVIYPLCAVAELTENQAIVAISEDQFESFEQEYGRFLSLPRNVAASYATEFIGMPLGALLPALLTTDEAPRLDSWQQYAEWIDGELDGKAAEPLSAGWAGRMFLWRAVSAIETGWMFSQDSFAPTIASDPYIEILEQMARCLALSKQNRLSPEQIWTQLQRGDLLAAIGFPFSTDGSTKTAAAAEISVSPLPSKNTVKRLMLDPFSPVVSVTTNCRQSSASKRMMNWLAGGEGSQPIRRQIASMTTTRSPKPSLATIATNESKSPYDAWLHEQMRHSVASPSLQLLAADHYHQILDDAVGRCLDGHTTAKQSLEEVANAWQAITESIGKEKQQSAWRRAQGMRA